LASALAFLIIALASASADAAISFANVSSVIFYSSKHLSKSYIKQDYE
jgi:hypothetical protein